MPGLLRGVARTAVIAGTATSVSGRVQRRQARRFGDPAPQGAVYAQPAPAPAAAPPDPVQQLQGLAELKREGLLTDEEFARQKAQILG